MSILDVPSEVAFELACKAHLGVWVEQKRGYENAPLHWEWAEQAMSQRRLALVAPRDHAKTETFTVSQVAWRCTYNPGFQCYVFAQTGDQATALKARIDAALEAAEPWMVEKMHSRSKSQSVYANWSSVTVAGAGKGVRGAHPDLIVGDDVLSEGTCATAYQRKKVEEWWFGTVGNMAHPGTTRKFGPPGRTVEVRMPPTRVHLVGTPFHADDLLMGMKANPLYRFRRYAAEFAPGDLVPGTLAVDVS